MCVCACVSLSLLLLAVRLLVLRVHGAHGFLQCIDLLLALCLALFITHFVVNAPWLNIFKGAQGSIHQLYCAFQACLARGEIIVGSFQVFLIKGLLCFFACDIGLGSLLQLQEFCSGFLLIFSRLIAVRSKSSLITSIIVTMPKA